MVNLRTTDGSICASHSRKYDMWCTNCNMQMCVECLTDMNGRHFNHNVLLFDKIVSIEKGYIESNIIKLEKTVSRYNLKTLKLKEEQLKLDIVDKQSDAVLLLEYIKSDEMMCPFHKMDSEVICVNCKECVCLKCLIDRDNVHRDHNVKTKNEIVSVIKDDAIKRTDVIIKKINSYAVQITVLQYRLVFQKDLLNKYDDDIINNYINRPKKIDEVLSVKYSDNKIIVRDFLRKNEFNKLLDYTDYDLACMMNRCIRGINFVEHIFTYCFDYKLVCYFIDNCIDLNTTNEDISIMKFACERSNLEIVKYLIDKGVTFFDSYWNTTRDNIKFINYASINVIDHIFAKILKLGSIFMSLLFDLKVVSDQKKIYHLNQ